MSLLDELDDAQPPARKPAKEKCDCPHFKSSHRLKNHTYECLLERRGNRTIDEYFGPPSLAQHFRPRA